VQLTCYSDYSLRVLIYLAVDPERLVTIEEIARSYAISKGHLMTVVHQLGLRGYVETVRGRGGGLRLARRPEEIRVGEVVRSTEENMILVECFDPTRSQCAHRAGVRVAFRAARSVRRLLERARALYAGRPRRETSQALDAASGSLVAACPRDGCPSPTG
jgi:Rrf2 family nitric oxide-sensitive transcriptional repressor